MSRTSVLSSNACKYHKNCLLVSFSWLMRSSLIFPTRLTTVLLDKAVLSILVFCSGHMILATSGMHFLINSPSENGVFFFASLYETIKLASVAAFCMIDCLVKTLCCFFSVFTSTWHFRFLSVLVKFRPKFACLVRLCLFKLYSLKIATDSRHNKQTALFPTSVK